MRSRAALYLVLGIVTALLLGVQSVNAAPVEITYMTFTYPEHPVEGQLIQRFQQLHPDIRVRVITKPVDQFENQLLLAYRAGDLPDVFQARPSYVTSLGLLGVMKDLSALAEREGPGYLDQFLPSALEMGTWQERLYGIPWRFGAFAVFVNPELFHEANVEIPESWTFEEFRETARHLAENGVYGYGFSGARSDLGTAQIWAAWLFANGGTLLDGGRAAFHRPEGVEVLQLWVDMTKQRLTPPNPALLTYKDITDLFGQGRLAMWINGPWYIATVQRAYPNAPMAFAPMPTGRSQGSATTGTLMAMSSQTKHEREAWEFLKYMTGPEAQEAWADATQYVPALADLLTRPFIQDSSLRVFADQAGLPNSQQVGNLPEAGRLFDILNVAIQEALMGTKTPEAALQNAAAQWDEILSKY